MKLKGIKNRIIRDYFAKSRGKEYHEIIRMALDHDYRVMSLIDFFTSYKKGEIDKNQKVLCLRHDIDIINPGATRNFFNIEKSLGVKATYYVRLYTLKSNLELIKDLIYEGFEVGYHYEELTVYAKERSIKNKEQLISDLDQIRNHFRENLTYLRTKYIPDIRSVCCHGDWIDNRLGIHNEIIINQQILKGLSLEFEAYQPSFMSLFDVYISDVADYPIRWKNGISPQVAMKEGKTRIYMLTHERNWFTNPICNTRANLRSIFEQVKYRIK